jgi:hypothetical protein
LRGDIGDLPLDTKGGPQAFFSQVGQLGSFQVIFVDDDDIRQKYLLKALFLGK